MTRIFFTYVLPLIGPMVLYLAWNRYAKAVARRNGGDEPSLEAGHIFWSLVAGFVLSTGILVTLALTGGEGRDNGHYVPPRYEDGKIIPPSFQKDPGKEPGK